MVLVTWDTVNKGTGVTISNGNLTAVIPNSANTVRASIGKTTGKWYWEVKVDVLATGGAMIGIVNSLAPLTSINSNTQNVRYMWTTGAKYPEATTYGTAFVVSDIIGVALDLDNGTLTFYKNGVNQGVSHTNIKAMGEVFPAITSGGSSVGNTNTANFGATPFMYPIPNGYNAYNYDPPLNKTLISLNGTTKYYNAGWKTVPTPPTKSDFETNGHDDLSKIPPEAWSTLLSTNPDIKLVTYVPTGNVAAKFDTTLHGKGLSLSAIPIPQFVHLKNPAGIYGNLSDLMVSEGVNNDVINNTRYLISPNKTSWYTWNGTGFVPIDTSVKSNILTKGMKYKTILDMQESNWTSWSHDSLYVGVYLDDNIRGKTTSMVDKISYADLAPKYSTKISDAKLYILNTTSTINVTFAGKTITGTVDDADSGKVQYRVLLNGVPYFPQSGEFTPLQAAPMDVALTLSNDEILIDQNNVLRIEFQDYWGATDYWQTNFVGTYSGLMFLDSTGKYYSTDVGEILQHLDFGIIIAGQTTVEQAIVLRNTYGYPVNNILIRANQTNFPTGMSARFGTNEISFESLDQLLYTQTLADGEELTFYIRLATQLGVTPPTSGEFDIIVTADKVI